MMKIPQNWLPHVHHDGCYWFWAPSEWSVTSPLSGGAAFALVSQRDRAFLEAFVLGLPAGRIAQGCELVEDAMKRSLVDDHPGLRTIRQGPFTIEDVDVVDGLARMTSLGLMGGYAFVEQMRGPAKCHRLTVEYNDQVMMSSGPATQKTTTDCFALLGGDMVLQLNMKGLSADYRNLARTFEQIAASARIGKFA